MVHTKSCTFCNVHTIFVWRCVSVTSHDKIEENRHCIWSGHVYSNYTHVSFWHRLCDVKKVTSGRDECWVHLHLSAFTKIGCISVNAWSGKSKEIGKKSCWHSRCLRSHNGDVAAFGIFFEMRFTKRMSCVICAGSVRSAHKCELANATIHLLIDIYI